MFGQATYIIWLALFIYAPILVLTVRYWNIVKRHLRTLGWVFLGSLVGGWLWDVLSVELGIWYFEPRNIIGIWPLGLPLEEWLWIIGVTLLFCLVTLVLMERKA